MRTILLLILLVMTPMHCTFTSRSSLTEQGRATRILPPDEHDAWQKRIAEGPLLLNTKLTVTYPYNGTVFPPEIAAPTIQWTDRSSAVSQWLVTFSFGDRHAPLYALSEAPQWTPDQGTWETIKSRSLSPGCNVAVYGIRPGPSRSLISRDRIRIVTSTDRVDASIFFRQVPLPFKADKQTLKKMKWRMGDIADYQKPAVVMEKMPDCASCHQFSKDGRLISMEMNFQGDSGAQFVAPVRKTITLSAGHFMTWRDFPKPDLLPHTRGVFAKLSPNGKYLIGTVNEIAFFALTNDPAYCQLFFPTYGVLAWYSVDRQMFQSLPGADDTRFVQTDPSWSWDEKYVVFARAETRNEYHDDISDIRVRVEDVDIHALNRKFPIQFDLYRIAFNKGRGSTPEPLEGASNNGMSNYFARYSPDNKWIVFTRSKSGIMLQPDSELFMIPAEGGTPRRMRCNLDRFNSWHSFSPNGKWMLFSSKVNSLYTEIFLTHIDENGMDSPPVCLSRFSEERYAANVPEFVNLPARAIEKIRLAGD
ncbi:MAG: hypothetical protein ABFS43_16410 [Thermodesulfobacteriota bacterium]